MNMVKKLIHLPQSILEDIQKFRKAYESTISESEAIRVLLKRALKKVKK